MSKVKQKVIVGANNHRQKNISIPLITSIMKYRKHLQREENIKFGRKARTISFVFATKSPKSLATFILNGGSDK